MTTTFRDTGSNADHALPVRTLATALQRLLERLARLVREDAPLPCTCVCALRAHMLHAVNIDTGLLALPLTGHKRVREGERWIALQPGDIFLVPNPRVLDIENTPDAASGEYLAIGIELHDNVLEAARRLLATHTVTERGSIAAVPVDDHLSALERWLDASLAGDAAMAQHAVLGLVLQLHAEGHHGLLAQPQPGLAERIRAMVAADPAREWTSLEIELALGMSGATLRRRLASEGSTLRAIIADARLAKGLALLLTTRLPVKAVAPRVGYASVSSFVKRFSERYGVEPSRVGSM